MKRKFAHNAPVILLLLITVVFGKLQYNKMGAAFDDYCMGICSDGCGYYAWLPAVFIYQDVNFNFFEQVQVKEAVCGGKVEGCLQDYRSCTDGVTCNKYYPGTAVMIAPFFAIAHFGTKWFTDFPPSGYSKLYFIFVAISGICYYFIGMLLFLQVLKKARLNTGQQTLTVLFVTFGSAIMYFAVDKPSYSHIYSFTQIAAFIYCALLLRERFTNARLAALTFLTGLIFITRPVNVSIALLVPFVFYDKPGGLLRNILYSRRSLLCLLPVLLMPVILLGLYKAATGHFFIYSYNNESFDFLHPHYWQFLFSYDNGVMPYTPLLLMPFALLFVWYKREHSGIVLGAAVTLVVTMYIHSSWWCWWYGFSFGARTMLDFTPICGLILGLSLKDAGKKRIMLLVPVYIGCCALTMILYHQKNHGFMNDFPIRDYWEAVRLK